MDTPDPSKTQTIVGTVLSTYTDPGQPGPMYKILQSPVPFRSAMHDFPAASIQAGFDSAQGHPKGLAKMIQAYRQDFMAAPGKAEN